MGLFCHTPGIPLARRVPRAISGYMLLTGTTQLYISYIIMVFILEYSLSNRKVHQKIGFDSFSLPHFCSFLGVLYKDYTIIIPNVAEMLTSYDNRLLFVPY